MSALEKILSLAGESGVPAGSSEGADLRVLAQAARETLALAVASGDPLEMARLVLAAQVAVEGIGAALATEMMPDWVEATACDPTLLALAGDRPGNGSMPYGDVTYADPGYRNGKKRYPIDNETHIRAAWAYINKDKNAGYYSSTQLAAIKSKIKSAAAKHGIKISGDADSDDKAAATAAASGSVLLMLAAAAAPNSNTKAVSSPKPSGARQPISMVGGQVVYSEVHGPMKGTHSHTVIHSHNGDSHHGGSSAPGYGGGMGNPGGSERPSGHGPGGYLGQIEPGVRAGTYGH